MKYEIHTITVIGAGEQGREIARAALLAGYRTILEDVSESRLAQAAAWIASMANVSAEARIGLVVMSKIEEAVREADLIIEAVADEMEMKIEMFTIFDKFAKPDAIFASITASISIEDLAAVTFCPEHCIGLRFASTPAEGKVLELVRAPDTSDETVIRCREFVLRIGREAIVTRERGHAPVDADATETPKGSHREPALSDAGLASAAGRVRGVSQGPTAKPQ
jgi:3-hydroxyacyl-CoA dehydrogenase